MSSLVKRSSGVLSSSSTSGRVGKSMAVAGGTGLGLWVLAGMIPFISFPVLMVMFIVAGLMMWE